MPSYRRNLFQLHLSVLLFGGTALFSQLLPWPALDITMFRSGIAALALALIVKLQGDRLSLASLRDYGTALLLGVVVGLHWVTYFAAMQLSTVAIGMIAFFSYPVITVFLEPLFERQRPEAGDVLCALVVLLGVYLLVPELSLANDTTLGILTGVVSAFLFALRNVLHKRQFAHYKGTQAMFYQTLVAAVMLAPFVTFDPREMNGEEFGLLMLLAVVFTATPHALLANTLRHLSAKTVGLISCLQPLYGTVLAALILAQWPQASTVTGGILIICAAAWETLHAGKKARQQASLAAEPPTK